MNKSDEIMQIFSEMRKTLRENVKYVGKPVVRIPEELYKQLFENKGVKQ